jgi:hypothetical protein
MTDPAPPLPRYFHSTLDVADFAPTVTVPEHEHRWVTEVNVTHDEYIQYAWPKHWYDSIELMDVFCAYPHCPARP